MTKKYHLFAGENRWPSGAEDYVKSFEKENEAIAYGRCLLNETEDWYEILETQQDGSLKILRRNKD